VWCNNARTLNVDTSSFLLVLLAAAVAPIIAALVGAKYRQVILPVVVVELLLGVLIGPNGLGLAHPDDVITFFGQLGLGFLFFFAGYEIRFDRIRGLPLKLALIGWVISLVLAYSIAGTLEVLGVVISGLLTGSAMATTALGTLIPMLRDEKLLDSRFGTHVLGVGAVGEFGPILIVTLLLSTTGSTSHQAILLIGFVIVAVLAGLVSTGMVTRNFRFIISKMDESGQLPVRLTVLMLFALVILASELGLDVILGAFAAGMIMNIILGGRDEMHPFESKLDAIGFGFLIPFFFLTSGMALDLGSLTQSVGAFLKLPMFLALFLVVRGLPAMLLYKDVFNKRERMSLALISAAELPLVVAITAIGVSEHEMRASTAAALVGAGVLSVLIFPSMAIALLRKDEASGLPVPEDEPDPLAI
jgi:Kef-type K+ transport system membrane component KefB